jgi:AcrR family transcriptional regulator
MSRGYTLRRRAEKQEETRRRIVEAAMELHRTIGPAASHFSAVAERAGVQRHTLYRHFPQPELLFDACRAHFLAANPPPEVGGWSGLADPAERARRGLDDLYRYYQANRDMISRVLRDADQVPVGSGFRRLQELVAEAMLGGHEDSTPRAVALLATAFGTWQTLVGTESLTHAQAVEVMSRLFGMVARSGQRAEPA